MVRNVEGPAQKKLYCLIPVSNYRNLAVEMAILQVLKKTLIQKFLYIFII